MKVNWSFIRLHRPTVQLMMDSEIITARVHVNNTEWITYGERVKAQKFQKTRGANTGVLTLALKRELQNL